MAPLRERLRTTLNNVEVFGLLRTVRTILSIVLAPRDDDSTFDRRFGTDTSSFLSNRDGGIPSELGKEVQRYEPAAEDVVRQILQRLPLRPEQTAFIDIGCGKGRVVLMAATLPFSRVIGVELSPVTSAIARRNLDILRARAPAKLKCRSVEILTENALEIDFPDSDIVFFLYNPFQGSMFERFMTKVHDFYSAHPQRKVLVAYCNPWFCGPWLEGSGRFRKVYEQRVIHPKWSWNLWEPIRTP